MYATVHSTGWLQVLNSDQFRACYQSLLRKSSFGFGWLVGFCFFPGNFLSICRQGDGEWTAIQRQKTWPWHTIVMVLGEWEKRRQDADIFRQFFSWGLVDLALLGAETVMWFFFVWGLSCAAVFQHCHGAPPAAGF